jgi:hypothetical protein
MTISSGILTSRNRRMAVFSLLSVLILGGMATGLPLGLPPGPEDPAMSRVAPAECLFYLSWVGSAEASPDSANHSERLIADPEMRRFVEELKKRLKTVLRQGAGKGERGQVVADEFPKLVETALTRPTALYLERIIPGTTPVSIQGGLVINLGDQSAAFEKSWRAMEEALGLKAEIVKDDAVSWHVLPQGGPTPVRWAVADGYFVAAFGEGVHAKLLARLKDGTPPEWLSSMRKRLPLTRVASVMHVDVKQFVGMAKASLGAVSPQEGAAIEKLGLQRI